jgi:hypothetical protein
MNPLLSQTYPVYILSPYTIHIESDKLSSPLHLRLPSSLSVFRVEWFVVRWVFALCGCDQCCQRVGGTCFLQFSGLMEQDE